MLRNVASWPLLEGAEGARRVAFESHGAYSNCQQKLLLI